MCPMLSLNCDSLETLIDAKYMMNIVISHDNRNRLYKFVYTLVHVQTCNQLFKK